MTRLSTTSTISAINTSRDAPQALEFHAPPRPGRHDFRLHDTDSNGRELTAATFDVTGRVIAEDIAQKLESRGRLALYGIHFESGSDRLDSESTATLEQVAKLLREDPNWRLLIEGHTGSEADDAFNLDLSQRRAAAVKKHLVDTYGVDPVRLTTRGFGESRPVAPNDNDDGRAQNRRVEIVKQ